MKTICMMSFATSLALGCSATPAAPPAAAKEPERVAGDAVGPGGSEAVWTHPAMNMTFRYPDQFLTVRHNPGGALLQSEVLGVEEDRSDRGEDRPTPFTISISITHNKLIDAAKVDGLGDMFPDGTEASFAEEKDVAERVTVAGKPGYGLLMGSHGEFERVVYATLDPIWTLAIRCDFVGEAARPKVSVSDQMTACERVISTLAIDLG